MKTAIINIKIDEKLKKSAQKITEEMGFNLSVYLNSCIKNLVRTKRVVIDLNQGEEPSEYLIQALKEADEENQCSPIFENGSEMISWINDKNRKYESGITKKVFKKIG